MLGWGGGCGVGLIALIQSKVDYVPTTLGYTFKHSLLNTVCVAATEVLFFLVGVGFVLYLFGK